MADVKESTLTEEQLAKIKAKFDKVDTDHNGIIDKNELRAVLEETLNRKLSDKLFNSYLGTSNNRFDSASLEG